MGKRFNNYSIEDQMNKFGITKEEAEIKIKNIKSVNVFSIEWQMSRFGLSKEEAELKIEEIKDKLKKTQSEMSDFEFNSMTPSKKEHWIKKGYSNEDAISKSKENTKQASNNIVNFNEDRIKNPEKYIGIHNTSIEYYIKKGYSEEKSREMLRERQRTFTMSSCIKKYGEFDGPKRWKERQDKWIKSMEGKVTNEMKDSTSFNYFLNKNNGDTSIAMIEYIQRFEKLYLGSKIGRASKSSMKIFKHLIDKCKEKDLKFYCGYEDSSEFYLFDRDSKKIYAYDFTIPELNIIFEFHGSFWHTKTPSNKTNKLGYSMSDSFLKDKLKKDLAIKSGFNLIELFEEDGIEYNVKKSLCSF